MDISPEDIAAMQAEGTLVDFIRHASGMRPKPAAPAEPVPRVEISRARPGAWPDGSRPPAPVPPAPPDEVARALAEHRAWFDAGLPETGSNCQRPCCTTIGETR